MRRFMGLNDYKGAQFILLWREISALSGTVTLSGRVWRVPWIRPPLSMNSIFELGPWAFLAPKETDARSSSVTRFVSS